MVFEPDVYIDTELEDPRLPYRGPSPLNPFHRIIERPLTPESQKFASIEG
jgi:hypothetical protein